MFMCSVILIILSHFIKYHFVTYCKTLDFVFVTLLVKTYYNVFTILGQLCFFDIVTFINYYFLCFQKCSATHLNSMHYFTLALSSNERAIMQST